MSFNATFIPSKAVHPTSAELYARAGVDYSSLSIVEQWWVDWYLWIADPMIATGLMSFVMHEVRAPRISRPMRPRRLNVL
jgi:methylsterol monooxygenase